MTPPVAQDRLRDLAAAYSASAGAWRDGPVRVYGRLAAVLVDTSPVPLAGRLVLDVGAGTGVAGQAVRAVGGRVVAADLVPAMVVAGGAGGIVADARRLPLRRDAVGGVVAAFCLNHLDRPADGLREARRVTAPGGPVLASSYGAEHEHPVRAAVDGALVARGYRQPPWYAAFKAGPVIALGTAAGMAAAWTAAGGTAREDDVDEVDVAFPELDAAGLIAWRLGLAHTAPFVARLSAARRDTLVTDALNRLDESPTLVRRMVVLHALV